MQLQFKIGTGSCQRPRVVETYHGLTPFGPSAVRPQWPYLGACVVSRAAEGESVPPGGAMTRGQLDALVAGAWGKPLPKLRGRAVALHLAS
eukprot:6789376-Pyramimonas_sp.AAC.1